MLASTAMDEPKPDDPSLPARAVRLGRGTVAAGRGIAERLGSIARLAVPAALLGVAAWEWLARRARRAATAGSDAWRERAAARRGRLEARAKQPLPSLWDVHPEARRALGSDIGLRSVPLDQIVGTAVAGPAQRGGDFLPLPAFRSANWQGRWARVRRAVENLTILPPVDLVKYGDDYWVEDGHNRVAAALYAGQVEIDAIVRELRMPGYTNDETTTVATLAPLAAAGSELRAAAAGRFDPEAASEAESTALDGGATNRRRTAADRAKASREAGAAGPRPDGPPSDAPTEAG